MKKKLITVLLAVSLVGTSFFSQVPINAYAADESGTAIETVQNIGDELYGFKLVKSQYKENSESTEMLFEHEKTGAKLLLIKNSDLNRGFSVSFNTPAENDKGINHILEHSLLAGGEKYPAKDVGFSILNNTYTSFSNAFTMQNTTMFPVTSQSEKQLMKLVDIYMDGVYHPLVAKDKKIFEREAWHYELEDADSPLTVNGIVYNEMRGNYGNIDGVKSENDKKAIFNDTNQQYDAGGAPSSILDLSYEEFMDTYNKNYTPSNSFMVLYGDVDYAKFLKMIDEEYLSSYDKKNVSIDKKEQPAFNSIVEKDYDFPVAKDYDTTNKSQVDIVFAMPTMENMSVEDYAGLTMAMTLLMDDSSDFMKNLRNSGIAEDYNIGIDSQTYQPTITISAVNMDSSRKNEFYDLVMNELKNEVSSGVNKELAKSIIASLKFSDALAKENGAVSELQIATIMNILFGDPMIDVNSYYKNMESKLDDRYVEDLIAKYLIKNTQVALVSTNPKAGLLEENNEILRQKLADKKASMSADEINALVDKTKEFKEWTCEETDPKVIDSIKAVKSKDIPVEVRDYNVKETENQGIKEITADADVSGIGSAQFIFDESHLTSEELLYLQFYSSLIDSDMSTKNHTGEEIKNEMTRKSAGASGYVSVVKDNKDGTSAHPIFGYNYIAMDDDHKDVLDLVSDVLLNSNLDDNYDDYIRNAINDEKQLYKFLCDEPRALITLRSMAYDNLYSRYQSYLLGMDYNNFIVKLEKEYNENPEQVINKIKEVRDKAFNKNNLTIMFAGNDDSKNKFNNEVGSFINKLSDKTYDKASYELPVPAKREGLIINNDVQFIAFNSNLNKSNITGGGKYYVLSKLLNEKMFIPQLRLKGGAYGAGASINGSDYNAYTFRDNDFVNSLNVINSTDEYMKDSAADITDDILDNYIISTYADNNTAESELFGAMGALSDYINDFTIEDKKQILNEIKETTADSLKNSWQDLEKLNDNANYVVAGSPEVINAHKDLFDEIISIQQ